MFSLTITAGQLMKKRRKINKNTISQNTINIQYLQTYILWQIVENICIKTTNYQILIAMVTVTRHIFHWCASALYAYRYCYKSSFDKQKMNKNMNNYKYNYNTLKQLISSCNVILYIVFMGDIFSL